jgi:hypothetical protein
MARPVRLRLTAALGLSLLAVAGCSTAVEPPDEVGACWHMATDKAGKISFNKVASNVPNMETCAMRLEVMRLQFLKLGGSRTEIQGAYQGQFIWIQRAGVYVSQTVDGNRYPALKRMPDGSLAVPSAIAVH